jgi:hypothetical protein
MHKPIALLTVVAGGLCPLSSPASAAPQPDANGWVTLWDGKTFAGWKASEHTNTWTIQDGALVARGQRSHLFYVGDDRPFANFEFKAEVMTRPGSNGGIFFHTRWQERDWPLAGMEVQVNNTYTKDPIKTGSLYQLRDVTQAPAKDNEWFTLHFKVEGKRVLITVNDQTTVDYTEPPDKKPGKDRPRMIDRGTFALQAHDPGSTVLYRNIRVKRLP